MKERLRGDAAVQVGRLALAAVSLGLNDDTSSPFVWLQRAIMGVNYLLFCT